MTDDKYVHLNFKKKENTMSARLLKGIAVGISLIVCQSAFAQWTPITGGIYYNGGNVGIGRTTASAKLHIAGAHNLVRFDYASIYNDPNFVFVQNAYYDGSYWQRMSTGTCASFGIGAQGDFSFSNDKATSGTPSFTTLVKILANGNVGIGTPNPSNLLHVVQPAGNATPVVCVEGNQAGPFQPVYLKNNDNNNTDVNRTAEICYDRTAAGTNKRMMVGLSGSSNRDFFFWSAQKGDVMNVKLDGKVGIGIATPSEALEVNGNIKANAVKIKNWSIEAPDYVFDKTYSLSSLNKVEKFIQTNKHLPEVPSAAEMKKQGVDLSEMNMVLLKKVEELTLYVITQNKKIENLEKKMAEKN
jgi:hypothetical protein